MISKHHRRRAFADSIGFNPFRQEQSPNGEYLFKAHDSILQVFVQEGKVKAARPVPAGELAQATLEAPLSGTEHHYVGMTLSDAVMQHLEEFQAPTSYERLSMSV